MKKAVRDAQFTPQSKRVRAAIGLFLSYSLGNLNVSELAAPVHTLLVEAEIEAREYRAELIERKRTGTGAATFKVPDSLKTPAQRAVTNGRRANLRHHRQRR